MSLQVQYFTLLMMFSSGLVLGVLFDAYRVLSDQLRIPRWTIPVLDIMYWALATVIVFRVLYISNQGELRIFVFLGLLIGITCYFALVSPIIVKVILIVIRTVKRLIRVFIRIFDIMVITPILALYKLLIIFLGILAVVSIFLSKFVIQLLYSVVVLPFKWVNPLWRRIPKPAWMSRLKKMLVKGLKRLKRLF